MAPMAKKKNQTKKHKFKYTEPTSGMTAQETASAPAPVGGSVAPKGRPQVAVTAASTRDFSYVYSDLRRIFLMAGSLVALELVLWYLFGHTGLGDAVLNAVKV
jgi:hypothetical protein